MESGYGFLYLFFNLQMKTMENQTPLDHSVEETAKPEWRTRYLVVESLLYVALLASGAALALGFHAGAYVILLSALGLIILNLVVPIIKLVRKEINVGLFILYLLRTLIVMLVLIGVAFKLESYPYASEFLIIGLTSIWPFFILIPNVEIRKYKANFLAHLLVSLIGIGLTIGYMGVLFSLEAWPYANELHIISMLLCLPIFISLIIMSRDQKYFYLKYYLPQLLLICCVNLYYLMT